MMNSEKEVRQHLHFIRMARKASPDNAFLKGYVWALLEILGDPLDEVTGED